MGIPLLIDSTDFNNRLRSDLLFLPLLIVLVYQQTRIGPDHIVEEGPFLERVVGSTRIEPGEGVVRKNASVFYPFPSSSFFFFKKKKELEKIDDGMVG
jgi:hypothetical protein